MSFSGFSEDDIRKLTKSQDTTKPQKGVNKIPAKKVTFKSNATNASRSKNVISNAANNNISNLQPQELPEEAKLSITNKNGKSKLDAINDSTVVTTTKTEEKTNTLNPEETQQTVTCAQYEKKIKDLDEFEARQKLIEEQNRKRKELLAKALADRTKQTQEEAQKLSEIQEEFKKLDAILSNDVKILRKQIEAASFDYMECQKRYNKIEKEFLEIKLLLHQKLEKKEMLTEHLCTIIEKNEERKGEKLTELLKKLQVKVPEGDVVSDEKCNNIT